MDGAQLLLYACADTLETLYLYAHDLHGEKLSSKGVQVSANNFTDRRSQLDYDLSRNKSLRELRITAGSLVTALTDRAPATTPSSLRAVLSTIESPAFSKVVVIYQEPDFYHSIYERTQDTKAALGEEFAWYERQFDMFREMYKARNFRLVLWGYRVGHDSMRELQRAVAAETARGGLPPKPSMTYTLGVC